MGSEGVSLEEPLAQDDRVGLPRGVLILNPWLKTAGWDYRVGFSLLTVLSGDIRRVLRMLGRMDWGRIPTLSSLHVWSPTAKHLG